MKTKKATSCISPRQTRTFFCFSFSLRRPHHRQCPFDVQSCGWNGDFHRKIPGVEVNVVRIQIDILFPLFSSPLCAAEPNPLFSRTVEWETFEMIRNAQDLKLLLLLLCSRSEKSNLLFSLQCFEILIASLSDRKLMSVRLDRSLTAWEWFLMMIMEQRTFIDGRLGFEATFACMNPMKSLRQNFLWWLYP